MNSSVLNPLQAVGASRRRDWVVVSATLCTFALATAPADSFALDHLSIGSAHPTDVARLLADDNGLESIDWHMHNCAFKRCFDDVAPLPFSAIASIMDTRGAMTMESDQEQWANGYERFEYEQVLTYNVGKPIASYVVTVRPTGWTWDARQWVQNPPSLLLSDAKALPPALLSAAAAADGRALYQYIPASAHPTSAWTPYQQKPDFAWGDYLNINAGVALDIPGWMYLENHLPPAMAAAGFTGDSWRRHIIMMFNKEEGRRIVYINMTGAGKDTADYVARAMTRMLADGMKVDRFIVVNFSGSPYKGDFVRDFRSIAAHFFLLRERYPS